MSEISVQDVQTGVLAEFERQMSEIEFHLAGYEKDAKFIGYLRSRDEAHVKVLRTELTPMHWILSRSAELLGYDDTVVVMKALVGLIKRADRLLASVQ